MRHGLRGILQRLSCCSCPAPARQVISQVKAMERTFWLSFVESFRADIPHSDTLIWRITWFRAERKPTGASEKARLRNKGQDGTGGLSAVKTAFRGPHYVLADAIPYNHEKWPRSMRYSRRSPLWQGAKAGHLVRWPYAA